MSAYTDPVGHGVEQQFRLRELEQAAQTTTSNTTTGR